MCPSGYAVGGTCPGNGLCCITGYMGGPDERKICEDAGALYIPKDLNLNPHTCEVPQGIQNCIKENIFESKLYDRDL